MWNKLRVWVDANHDGVSQPEELHTLDEVGILSILLHYERSPYTDQYGNQFRYEGHLVPVRGDDVDRKIFDVTLATPQGQNANSAGEDMNAISVSTSPKALQALASLKDRMPDGALLVRNNSPRPIMAMVIKWTIPTKSRTTRIQWLYLDGYYLPEPQPVLSPGSQALITRYGIAREEDFARLVQYPDMTGSPLTGFQEAVPAEPGTIGTVDAVFYPDGRIEGADASEYEKTILMRHGAFQSLVSDLGDSANSTELKQRAERILSEPAGPSNPIAHIRRQTANFIYKSSDPMVFLTALKGHSIPVTFYHSESETERRRDEPDK